MKGRNRHSHTFTGAHTGGAASNRGRPPVGKFQTRKAKPNEREFPTDEDDSSIAPEHDAEIPRPVSEPPPPPAANLFSAGLVADAAYGPLDAFLASPKPLRPPTRRTTR